MSFKTDMADALGTLYNAEFAELVSYGGSDIYAFVEYKPSQGASSVAYQVVLQVQVSDVPAPAYRTPVVIDGATWHTGRPEDCEGDGFEWKIPLMRDEKVRLK